jgi:hypothetical protein
MPLLDFGRLRPKGEIGMNYEQEKQAALNLKANAEEKGFNIEGSHIRLINYVTGEVRECISDNWHNNVRTIKRCIHEDIDWCSAAGYPNV